MADNEAQFLDSIAWKLEDALRSVGNDTVERLAAELSSPAPPPSQPGQEPHMQTGQLASSLDSGVSATDAEVTLNVSVGTDHAHYLEFGTDSMVARPFMRPEMERLKQSVLQQIAERLKV